MSGVLVIEIAEELWEELIKITKLYAHSRSALKIGSVEEAKTFEAKADKLAIQWCRKQRPKNP